MYLIGVNGRHFAGRFFKFPFLKLVFSMLGENYSPLSLFPAGGGDFLQQLPAAQELFFWAIR